MVAKMRTLPDLEPLSIKCNNINPVGKLQVHQGEQEIQGIRELDIRMRVNELVTCTLSLFINDVTVKANPLLSLKTVKECAYYYGYDLVVKEK